MILEKNKEAEYFSYLDNLRESGNTNMFGASPYLETQFGLDSASAKSILISWMKNHGSRNP